MDRQRLSHLAHERHPIACPFSAGTVDELVDRLVLPRTASVLDLGCGRGEWVVRILERFGHATAVAVDSSPLALEAAGTRARAAEIKDRLTLFEGDGAEYLANAGADYDLIVCAGADHCFGSVADAWKTLRSHLRPGGVLLMAHGFWLGEPPASALEVLGESLRELPQGMDALVDSVVSHRLTPLFVKESTQREWDDYEWSWMGTLEEHAQVNPGDAPAVREAVDAHRAGYFQGYRGALGYAAVIARRVD